MSTNESQAPESGADDDARRKREYRVMIDKTLFVLTEPVVTGRQLLVQAGKLPPGTVAVGSAARWPQPGQWRKPSRRWWSSPAARPCRVLDALWQSH